MGVLSDGGIVRWGFCPMGYCPGGGIVRNQVGVLSPGGSVRAPSPAAHYQPDYKYINAR